MKLTPKEKRIITIALNLLITKITLRIQAIPPFGNCTINSKYKLRITKTEKLIKKINRA